MIHYATCTAWQSGLLPDCNCTWRIRHIGLLGWQVQRRTGGDGYEPFLRCPSYEAASQLVDSMNWLTGRLRGSADV